MSNYSYHNSNSRKLRYTIKRLTIKRIAAIESIARQKKKLATLGLSPNQHALAKKWLLAAEKRKEMVDKEHYLARKKLFFAIPLRYMYNNRVLLHYEDIIQDMHLQVKA